MTVIPRHAPYIVIAALIAILAFTLTYYNLPKPSRPKIISVSVALPMDNGTEQLYVIFTEDLHCLYYTKNASEAIQFAINEASK